MSTRTRAKGTWIFPAVLAVVALAGLLAQLAVDPVGLWVFVLVLGGWMITLCLHEFAHAAVALAGGDSSVRARGYLTLNPLRYTDAANSLVIPIILLAIGGIPLPGGAVVTEPHRLRPSWWASLISAAGPATNRWSASYSRCLGAVHLGVGVGRRVVLPGIAAVRRSDPQPAAGAPVRRLRHPLPVPAAAGW